MNIIRWLSFSFFGRKWMSIFVFGRKWNFIFVGIFIYGQKWKMLFGRPLVYITKRLWCILDVLRCLKLRLVLNTSLGLGLEIILQSWSWSWKKSLDYITAQFQGEPRQWGVTIMGVGKICDFRLRSSFILAMIPDKPMDGPLIGSPRSLIYSCRFHWPWATSKSAKFSDGSV